MNDNAISVLEEKKLTVLITSGYTEKKIYKVLKYHTILFASIFHDRIALPFEWTTFFADILCEQYRVYNVVDWQLF